MKRYFKVKRFGLGIGVVVMGVILGLWADWALATGNLLNNPGAENYMDNWTTHGTRFSYRNSGTDGHYARNGSKFFYGGDDNDYSQASQYINVSGYAKAIDDGQVWADFSGYAMGCGQDDKGRLDLLFWWDGGGIEHTTGWHGLPDDRWECWCGEFSNKLLPSGTRKVEVRMQADEDDTGNNNDAYFDDLCLTLKAPGLSVIEPVPSEGVTLYEGINYTGKSLIQKNSDCNLGDDNFNDIASSIKVPTGWQVRLYNGWYYTGDSLERTGNDSTLVNDSFNDIVSSIMIEKRRFNFDFGDVYLATSQSTKDYNYSKKKILKFKNSGDSDTKLKWSISSSQSWIKFSQGSGNLPGQDEQSIEVWLEPTGGTGTYNGTISFTSTRGDVEIVVAAKAYQTTQISYVGPAKGTNGKVNVARDESVEYEIKNEGGPFYPGATFGKYMWKKDNQPAFEDSPDRKRYYTFDQSGEPMIYCKTYEMANGKRVESGTLSIPVRVWIRPTVNNNPPQSAIDSAIVSWYDSKYVGIKGEPVYLCGTGTKGSDDLSENITKYLWDFNNDWQTIELEQSAGQVVSHIWNSSNLSGSIRCKAVTNYGVKSDEKVFNLKIYDTPALDAKGPYTGKPTKAVELACSMNQTAYPGATFEYQWRIGGIETAYNLKGSATQKTDYIEETPITAEMTLKGSDTQETGYIKLTTNQQDKNGQVEYTNLSLGENWSVSGEFWTGGGNGADAFYIYAFATATPQSEDSNQGQYSINYDEYHDQIQLKYAGNTLKAVTQSSIDNSTWHQFKVICTKGKFQIYLDNVLKLEYDDSANYSNRATNNLFGFGARTGGSTNEHSVKNMQWNKRTLYMADYIELTPNESNKNGQVEYADLQLSDKWSVSGEFWAGNNSGSYFYIYAYANGTPQENSDKGQYCVNYNEWEDKIELKYKGTNLSTIAQSDLNNSQWRQFAVTCNQGVFKIYLDHNLRLQYDDSTNYASRTTNKLFGFGARTGASNNYHRIRNMQWTLGSTTATDGQGKAKYTWTEGGTYSLQTEVIVTTAEGLVLIDIATTTATIEAGICKPIINLTIESFYVIIFPPEIRRWHGYEKNKACDYAS